MMLKELYRIGLDMQAQGLDWPIPMYTERKIYWDIALEDDGQFNVTPIDHKDKSLGKILAPDRQRSGRITDKPYLIVDKPAFVLGLGKDGEAAHRHYLELMKQCAVDTGNNNLNSLIIFMQEHRDKLVQSMYQKGFTEKDEALNQWIDFQVAGYRLTENADIQHWWLNYVREAQYEMDKEETCSISGKFGKVIRLFPGDIPLRFIENGRSSLSLCKLSSVDSPSCKSYTFDKSDHSPMTFDAALIASTALKKLLTDSTTSHRLGDLNFAFWTRDGLFRRVISCCCDEYDEESRASEDIKTILDSIYQGSAIAKYPSNDQFYLFVATNTKTRVVIRASLEAKLEKVLESIRHWFKAINVVNVFMKPVPLHAIQRALQISNKRQNSTIQLELLQHAFLGKPISRATFARVFPRIESAIHNKKDDPKFREPKLEQVAFIMLYLSQGYPEVISMGKTDENINDLAFQYGRLLAAYERIQHEASPKVQSTVSERFFSAMMLNPLRTVANLERLCKTHLHKIARDHNPLEANLLWQIKRINSAIDPDCARECHGFTLDQRGMFVLGYWREKHIFSKSNKSKEEANDGNQSESTNL